jgi:hypothetical protein
MQQAEEAVEEVQDEEEEESDGDGDGKKKKRKAGEAAGKGKGKPGGGGGGGGGGTGGRRGRWKDWGIDLKTYMQVQFYNIAYITLNCVFMLYNLFYVI